MRRFHLILVCAMLVALLSMISVGCSTTEEEGATDAVPEVIESQSVSPDPTLEGWTKVFSWEGGGEGAFGGNSESFTLKGGKQRIDMVVKGVKDTKPSANWVLSSEYHVKEITTAKEEDSTTSSLPSGEYRITADTLDCYWTLTIYEKR